jgi:hypothetical protein
VRCTPYLATLLKDTNRLAEAEPLSRHATLILARSLGWQHPNTKLASSNWSEMLSELGKQPETELKRLQDVTQSLPDTP